VPGCDEGPIEFAHIRTAANSGTGLKPHDRYGISLFHAHHSEAHDKGHATFAKKYGSDLLGLANEFTQKTTDKVLKAQIALDMINR